jgi:DNA-binding transcriptional regulator YiaG
VPEPDSFATKITALRKKHNLTQEAMSEVFPSGFSVNTLRNWEQERSAPALWMQPLILWWLEWKVFRAKLGKRT